jgi:hypothetical protein
MLTGKGQTIVNEFKAVVDEAKIIAKSAAGDAGADFAEIMAIVDGYVAIIPKEISRAAAFFKKLWLGVKAVWYWLMNIFQFLNDANGKFSSKRAAFFAVLIVGISRLYNDRDLQAAGCGVVVVFLGLWIAMESMKAKEVKKPTMQIGPQAPLQPGIANTPVDPMLGGMQ